MDIKDKLSGKTEDINLVKPKQETPEDFTQTSEAKEAIDEADDMDIKDFIAKKKAQQAEKDARKEKKKEEPVKAPVKPLEEVIPQAPQIEEQAGTEKQSSFAKVLTIYMTLDKVERTKEILQGAVDGGYLVAMQAGLHVTKENVERVKSVLKYLAENGYLVVISGEQVEPVFDETAK